MRRLKILTWHIHGSYLYYLSRLPHEIYLPVLPGDARSATRDVPEGYVGRTRSYAWPENVHEIPWPEISRSSFDCVIYQSKSAYLEDRFRILSEEQRKLPSLYIEHDPPREHPTDTRHVTSQDPNVVVVQVTAFNRMMWDTGKARSRVIEHGVEVPEDARYSGDLERGVAVVNNIVKRGRRLGSDIFGETRKSIPLDLFGMGAEEVGGVGELSHRELPRAVSRYRFFFNPIRYTSLGLSVCEAMSVGLPIVGLATTEMVTVVENGFSGFVDTDPDRLIEPMRELLKNPTLARRIGENARAVAMNRFSIGRFVSDWNRLLSEVTYL